MVANQGRHPKEVAHRSRPQPADTIGFLLKFPGWRAVRREKL